MSSAIQVYGAGWCGLTLQVREYLTRSRFTYDYFDIDTSREANEFVLAMNDGKRRLPMIVIEERIVTNPTIEELRHIIDASRIRSEIRNGGRHRPDEQQRRHRGR